MQRFRGGLVFKAHRLCVSLNSGLESNKEDKNKSAICRGMRHCQSAAQSDAPAGREFENNYFTEMSGGSEAGSYLRLIDSCITQLKAQGPF